MKNRQLSPEVWIRRQGSKRMVSGQVWESRQVFGWGFLLLLFMVRSSSMLKCSQDGTNREGEVVNAGVNL